MKVLKFLQRQRDIYSLEAGYINQSRHLFNRSVKKDSYILNSKKLG